MGVQALICENELVALNKEESRTQAVRMKLLHSYIRNENRRQVRRADNLTTFKEMVVWKSW